LKKNLNILAELTKIRITLFVTITTLFGFISAAGKITTDAIAPTVGILLLACGSAVINHIQERDTDAKMDRTKNRPLPSGRIKLQHAVLIAAILTLSGSVTLFWGAGITALGLALLNLIWYNVIYTPLKRKNAMAVIPGSLVGAIPPAVGWVAAGGYILDPHILIISFFFFIWQIPHFWILLLMLGKDYEQAGLPSLTKIFSADQLARITFMWTAATVVTSLLIPLFGIVQSPFIAYSLVVIGLLMTIKAFRLLLTGKEKLYFRYVFRGINSFALSVIVLLSIDKLFFLS
jgi:protoheme IX farnesyltransferase